MHIHPAIAALRRDRAKQVSAFSLMRQAHKDWLKSARITAISRDLERLGQTGAIEPGSALAALMYDHAQARRFVDDFHRAFLEPLRTKPLGEAPFRHSVGAGFLKLELLQNARCSLSLCVYEPLDEKQRADDAAQTVRFADCDMREMVVAGSGRGRLIALREGSAPVITAQDWQAGDQIACLPRVEARQITAVSRSLLVLQLVQTRPNPAPTLEHCASHGTVLRQTSANRRASEQIMALGVLGALANGARAGERNLAAMTDFARDQAHDRHARWEAVRQMVAGDTARGMKLLEDLALCEGDALSGPAAQLHAELIERRTQSQAHSQPCDDSIPQTRPATLPKRRAAAG